MIKNFFQTCLKWSYLEQHVNLSHHDDEILSAEGCAFISITAQVQKTILVILFIEGLI